MAGRQSNFELLRIVAMAMIVLAHVAGHPDWASPALLQPFLPLGKIGVALFVFISGYFLITSEGSQLRRVWKLWRTVIFYSVTLSVAAWLIWDEGIPLTSLTPVLSEEWWFVTSYVILLLIVPYINGRFRSLEERSQLLTIAGCILVWTVAPAFSDIFNGLLNTIWVIILYLVGAYLRLHPCTLPNAYLLAMSAAGYVLLLAFAFWIPGITPLYHSNLQMATLVALPVFIVFSRLRLESDTVNAIAAAAFAVYLIHEHPSVRAHLYTDVLDCASVSGDIATLIYAIMSAALIFSSCVIIEMLRTAVIKGMRPLPR